MFKWIPWALELQGQDHCPQRLACIIRLHHRRTSIPLPALRSEDQVGCFLEDPQPPRTDRLTVAVCFLKVHILQSVFLHGILIPSTPVDFQSEWAKNFEALGSGCPSINFVLLEGRWQSFTTTLCCSAAGFWDVPASLNHGLGCNSNRGNE